MTRTSRQESRALAHAPRRAPELSVRHDPTHERPSEPSAKFTPRAVGLPAQLQHPSVRLSHRRTAAGLGEDGRTIEHGQRRVQKHVPDSVEGLLRAFEEDQVFRRSSDVFTSDGIDTGLGTRGIDPVRLSPCPSEF